MTANKLTLTINKSNLIVINLKTNNHFNNLPSSNADIISPKILTVKSAKYFGVTFDNSLSFDCHIKNLEKIIKISGNSSKGKTITKPMLSFYYAIFHSHLQYGLKLLLGALRIG